MRAKPEERLYFPLPVTRFRRGSAMQKSRGRSGDLPLESSLVTALSRIENYKFEPEQVPVLLLILIGP